VITVFLAESIETVARHPMVRKVMRDETDFVGRVASRRLEEAIEESVTVSAPLLARAMDAGYVRRQDPVALGHWLARISMICLVTPPPGDLRQALDELLLPVLDPGARTRPRPRKRS
jgi:hypothetical protein